MRTSKPWSVPEPPPLQPAISGLDYEALQQCIHCGFCLEACPTYRESRLETASPRGRLSLMRAVAEGRLPVDAGFAEALELCLGCRSCETACPSGVRYGHLLEEARVLTAPVRPPAPLVRFGLKQLMPHPSRMRLMGRLLRWAQRSGLLGWLARRGWMPRAAGELAAALPPVGAHSPYPAPEQPGALYFHGCVQEGMLPQQNRAAVRMMERLGTPCAVPPGQTCCGALHMHQGDREGARELARRNIAAFEAHPELPVINHAGGCGTHLKQYGELLADDPAWAERARRFAARVKDLSEWLVAAGAVERLPALARTGGGVRVTYQDSCHLAHGQRVRVQPRALLRALPGVAYQEMAGADQCCGSAGIYNLVQPAMAGAVLSRKMEAVGEAQPAVVVTANPGCHLQLCQGVRQAGLEGQVRVLSLAEFLEEQVGG
ncbi:MAG: (Fe-S)-binding protein [Bacillota bacterium]